MAQSRTCLAAWTPPGPEPKYINASYIDGEDGGVEFTVRSPKDLGGLTAVCRLPHDVAEEFITELADAFLRAKGIDPAAVIVDYLKKQAEK